jgi:hypothetical protein
VEGVRAEQSGADQCSARRPAGQPGLLIPEVGSAGRQHVAREPAVSADRRGSVRS